MLDALHRLRLAAQTQEGFALKVKDVLLRYKDSLHHPHCNPLVAYSKCVNLHADLLGWFKLDLPVSASPRGR